MAKPQAQPFDVGLCAVCDEARLTFGTPGVRYCSDCLKGTLGWVQMTEDQRQTVLAMYQRLEAMPTVQARLERLGTLTPAERQAIAIGEAHRRLMDAER